MTKFTINPVEFIINFKRGKDAMIIQLKNVRLAFFDGYVPVAFEEGQDKKYGSTFLVPKKDPQHKIIQQAIQEVAAAEWKDKAKSMLASFEGNPQKYCYQDGDKKTYDGYAGCMALAAKSKKRPNIFDRNKSPLTEADEKPYSGCYVNASVEIWAQSQPSKHAGIRCQLRGIQFVRDGDAFSAGTVASEDEFEDLGDGANTEDEDDLA